MRAGPDGARNVQHCSVVPPTYRPDAVITFNTFLIPPNSALVGHLGDDTSSLSGQKRVKHFCSLPHDANVLDQSFRIAIHPAALALILWHSRAQQVEFAARLAHHCPRSLAHFGASPRLRLLIGHRCSFIQSFPRSLVILHH